MSAPEFIDDEALDYLSFFRLQQLQRSHQGREDAATVDVAAEEHGSIGVESNPHVDDLGGFKVYLRRAARALDHHDVVLISQNVQRGVNRFPELGFQLQVVHGPGRCIRTAHQDHLRPLVSLRLEQDWIHLHLGFNAGGLGLDRLGPADLATVRGDVGVFGLVLGLDCRDTKRVLAKVAS